MRTWRKFAAAAAALLLLSGCTNNQGVAARVNGEIIPASAVSTTLHELRPLLAAGSPGAVLASFVIGPVFLDAAESIGVGVSAEEAVVFLESAAASNGIELGELSPETIEFGRINLSVNNLLMSPQVEQLLGQIEREILALDVEINPRYGVYDETPGYIIDAEPPWIVSQ
jgi:hypothetical protein